jgi:hypothetical protein
VCIRVPEEDYWAEFAVAARYHQTPAGKGLEAARPPFFLKRSVKPSTQQNTIGDSALHAEVQLLEVYREIYLGRGWHKENHDLFSTD